MTVALAIDWEAVQDAIWQWFSESTELVTVWADQDMPQPKYPYASLDIISGPTRVGGQDDVVRVTDLAQVGEEVQHRRIGLRQFIIACQIHVGPKRNQFATFQEPTPNCNARALMSSAEAQLETFAIHQIFRDACLAFVRRTEMLSLDLPIAGEILSRVQMDIEFATNSVVDERTTYIEDVGMTGTFTDPGDTTLPPEDFSITGL